MFNKTDPKILLDQDCQECYESVKPEDFGVECKAIVNDLLKDGQIRSACALLKTIHTLRNAIVDLMDGQSSWYDTQANTGLDEERCKELSHLFGLLAGVGNPQKGNNHA